MIKNINVDKLLLSDLFVSDVVGQTNAGIDIIGGNRVILAGNRGTGRSVILSSREREHAGSENPSIYTRFDACGMFGKREDEVFNREFMEHYYEVLMSGKILDYVRRFYPDVYVKKFMKDDALYEGRLYDTDKYIRDAYYVERQLREKFSPKEITGDLVGKVRNSIGADSLELMIDRFDWTHNSDERIQSILANYFDLFDRTIITSDDSTIDKKHLNDEGYSIGQCGYTHIPVVVREIIKRRIDLGKEMNQDETPFPIDEVSDKTIRDLVDRTDGNMNLMLNAMIEAESLYSWHGEKADVDEVVDRAASLALESEKQLRKVSHPQKLHL